MPIATSDKAKGSEQMWDALKAHVVRERQRKKQEREQEVEEERLRKEREAREEQDVMSLGETREQILQLEQKLSQLKDEKHQLFLQLKKVLNEDDNRRRQLVKENNDMLAMQALPPVGLVHQQIYIQQPPAPRPNLPVASGFKHVNKRPRSPSPGPVPLYHQNYAYKSPAVSSASYQPSPQKEDSRRGHELVRAVLWNKPQYASQPGGFYTVPPQDLVYYPPMTREPPSRPVYEPARPQAYHIEPKHVEHYSIRAPAAARMALHGPSIPISPAQPPAKTGSITAGYPVRTQAQYPPQTPVSTSALYTAAVRPLYPSPGAPLPYPPRD